MDIVLASNVKHDTILDKNRSLSKQCKHILHNITIGQQLPAGGSAAEGFVVY